MGSIGRNRIRRPLGGTGFYTYRRFFSGIAVHILFDYPNQSAIYDCAEGMEQRNSHIGSIRRIACGSFRGSGIFLSCLLHGTSALLPATLLLYCVVRAGILPIPPKIGQFFFWERISPYDMGTQRLLHGGLCGGYGYRVAFCEYGGIYSFYCSLYCFLRLFFR